MVLNVAFGSEADLSADQIPNWSKIDQLVRFQSGAETVKSEIPLFTWFAACQRLTSVYGLHLFYNSNSA